MTNDRYATFSERYASGDLPWDSGITPPEIMELLAARPAGNALDLGCGTGTVIRDLLLHGWRADGVDFVPRAVDIARAKLNDFPPESHRLFCHDVRRLHELPALLDDYALIIDIGCGHSLGGDAMADYARAIATRLASGGIFMLYASHPRPESTVGWAPRQVADVFQARLDLLWEQRGDDRAIGAPVSWYKLRKR
jgi:SAM-dependent methyltransferase